VVCGALVLATSLILTLRSWRSAFPDHVGLALDTSAVAGGTGVGAMQPPPSHGRGRPAVVFGSRPGRGAKA
jgi:hypothetical protein